MNYIKIFNAYDTADAEQQVNVFLAGCKDRLIDIKIRSNEDACSITLVMGTFHRYKPKKFEILECSQSADEINMAIEEWRHRYSFIRQLEDVVFINEASRVYLKIIYTEKDQIRERKFNNIR